MNRFSALSTLFAVIAFAGSAHAEDVSDCELPFVNVPAPNRACIDVGRGFFFPDGDDVASETDFVLEIAVNGALTIDALIGEPNFDEIDKFYLVSEFIAANPGERADRPDEIFGPYEYAVGGSTPARTILDVATIEMLMPLQSKSTNKLLVLLDEPIGHDIFNPGAELFTGIRFGGGGVEITQDYGDAPAPYPTRFANNGARHTVVVGISMTAPGDPPPDREFDAIVMAANAFGDDFAGDDDELGVDPRLGGVLQRGAIASVRVHASTNLGMLSAWMDYNRDGDWADPGERIFTNLALASGINNLQFAVPPTAGLGTTYGRFRFSTELILQPTGSASNGEVEDHQFLLADLDFGDAPDRYGTLKASLGPSHDLSPNYSLGLTIDGEDDGQPSVHADGDDGPALLASDEDGVWFDPNVVPGETLDLAILNGRRPAFVNAWIDYNRDGDFADANELVILNLALGMGPGPVVTVPIAVPVDADFGQSYLRVRLSDVGVNPPTPLGYGGVGEVEDYELFFVLGFDYGDAPAPYPTLDDENGARHPILVDFHLGQLNDADLDGIPDAQALGDDLNAQPDEDGVQFDQHVGAFPVLYLDEINRLQVQASRAGGVLHAWVDNNRDGDWNDADERLLSNQALADGANELFVTLPSGIEGESFARFRLTFPLRTDELPLTPDQSGLTIDEVGEVEDYIVRLVRRIHVDGFE